MSTQAQLLVIAAVCCFVLGAITWAGVCEWLDRHARRRETQRLEAWKRSVGQ